MKKKNILLTIILILVIIFFAGFFLISTQNKNPQNNHVDNTEIPLNDDLIITHIGPYTGEYMEDGTDEEVRDVLMITVQNNGAQTLQYAETQLIYDGVTAEFSFSTLKPGDSMIVLEKNRLKYEENREIKSTNIENVVIFQNELNYCEDKFEIFGKDGAFNVKNISGEDLSGNIAIYYKNIKNGIYQGGITYRVVIEGGIEKDGIKQIMTEHFKLDESIVMFVDYVEME